MPCKDVDLVIKMCKDFHEYLEGTLYLSINILPFKKWKEYVLSILKSGRMPTCACNCKIPLTFNPQMSRYCKFTLKSNTYSMYLMFASYKGIIVKTLIKLSFMIYIQLISQ